MQAKNISGDFKPIKNTGSFAFALRVYDVGNLLTFIPIQQSVGMPSYYADSVEIVHPVSCGSGDATVAPDALKPTSGTTDEISPVLIRKCVLDCFSSYFWLASPMFYNVDCDLVALWDLV